LTSSVLTPVEAAKNHFRKGSGFLVVKNTGDGGGFVQQKTALKYFLEPGYYFLYNIFNIYFVVHLFNF